MFFLMASETATLLLLFKTISAPKRVYNGQTSQFMKSTKIIIDDKSMKYRNHSVSSKTGKIRVSLNMYVLRIIHDEKHRSK